MASDFAASLLVAEVCDVNHFSSDRKLVVWTGLASISPGRRSGLEGSIVGETSGFVRLWFIFCGEEQSEGSGGGGPRDAADRLVHVEKEGALSLFYALCIMRK